MPLLVIATKQSAPRAPDSPVTAYLVVVLLVLYGAAFYLQDSTHCLRHGILEHAELVADLSGERMRMSKMDRLQCVGLAEKPGRFAYGDPATQNNDDAEVEELAKLIAKKNARAAKVKDRDVVTAVVATMLSSSERVKRYLAAGVNKLRGAYLAQRDWNQLDGLGRNPLVRLVLANFCGACKYAVKVAEQIRAYAECAPSVIAVLGPSMDQPTGIPMVGWSLSSTNFSQKPYFFRVTPANDRQRGCHAAGSGGDGHLREVTEPAHPLHRPHRGGRWAADGAEPQQLHRPDGVRR